MLAFQRQVPFCDRLPLLTSLGLCIWNPGFPPTSMEILWAEGGWVSGIPTPDRSPQTTGWGQERCSQREMLLSETSESCPSFSESG